MYAGLQARKHESRRTLERSRRLEEQAVYLNIVSTTLSVQDRLRAYGFTPTTFPV